MLSRLIRLCLAACVAALVLPATGVASAPHKPTIVSKPIPFGAERKADMAQYAKRHYGLDTYALTDPKVIVEHYTVTTTFSPVFNAFSSNNPDPELHEKPGTCAHFVVDRDGKIYQLVPLTVMCRHTVGLNYTAIGIEHVGMSDDGVLSNKRQMRASLRLTRWLRCSNHIAPRNVIGHAESLSSPFHMERIESLQNQTHGDFPRPKMKKYRSRLKKLGACS
ncbi:MAG TPA: peptidoglycan recognition family protein [Baekduia sp.]|nr:peptidoglycan recognition family protein [Baekduia sp.]